MRRKPKTLDRQNARLLAGVLLLGLIAAAPLCADSAPDAAPATETASVAIPAPDAVIVSGPASLSLGAEARLELPEGWRFVARDQLPAFWRGQDKKLGAWDRGVVLDAAGHELRLLFEPCGRVASEAGLQSATLLERAQALERAAHPDAARELRWQQDPLWDGAAAILSLSAVWRLNDEESASLHLRWLGRAGVLKLDLRVPLDQADAARASLDVLRQALQWAPGQAYPPSPAAGAPASKLSLDALALDCLVGRGVLSPSADAGSSFGTRVALGLGLLLLLGWGLYKAVLGLRAWLEARRRAQADAARLDKLEKEYGGRAEDVEEIEE
jgi:uncharacterized membrane-anchored protein